MQKIETEHGEFNNNEVTGRTADELYQEWLENKDKPLQPTELEFLKAKLQKAEELAIENSLNQQQLLELLLEMGVL